MKELTTTVKFQFQGTAKSKRKTDFQSVQIEVKEGHIKLSSDDITKYQNEAKDFLKEYKNITRLQIVTNHGFCENGMNMVMLLPNERILI